MKKMIAVLALALCFISASQVSGWDLDPNCNQKIIPRDNRHVVIMLEKGLHVNIFATKGGDSCGSYTTSSGIVDKQIIPAGETTILDTVGKYMTFQCDEKEIFVKW